MKQHLDLSDPEKTAENAGILYDSVHQKLAPLGEFAHLTISAKIVTARRGT